LRSSVKRALICNRMRGGGSNFAGLAFPYVCDKIHGSKITIIPTEPTACPTLTRGPFAYDFGDTARQTPLLAMYTLGHGFVPPPIHAGGLRYHGMAPLVSHAAHEKLIEPRAYDQIKCYESAIIWANTEGAICAPETSHAIACVIEEAKRAKAEGKEKVILFNYSGHGLMDLWDMTNILTASLQNMPCPKKTEEVSRVYQRLAKAIKAIRMRLRKFLPCFGLTALKWPGCQRQRKVLGNPYAFVRRKS